MFFESENFEKADKIYVKEEVDLSRKIIFNG